jgi:hypothetical protein
MKKNNEREKILEVVEGKMWATDIVLGSTTGCFLPRVIYYLAPQFAYKYRYGAGTPSIARRALWRVELEPWA